MYYVMSAEITNGSPSSLLSDFVVEEQDFDKETYGYLPWYASPESCKLPSQLMLLSQAKYYDFAIRRFEANLYVVSETFLSILKSFSVPVESFSNLKVLSMKKNSSGKSIVKEPYYLIRIAYSNFYEIVDTAKSDIVLDDLIMPKKLVFLENVSEKIIFFRELANSYRTPICSEEFKRACVKMNQQGICFYELERAHWQTDNDFMALLEDGLTNQVWPI